MRRILLLASAVAIGGLATLASANAQSYGNDVVAHCSQTVGQMKFEGWPADRNRDMMMLACEQNGGTIPGTAQENAQRENAQQSRPAALHPRGRAR